MRDFRCQIDIRTKCVGDRWLEDQLQFRFPLQDGIFSNPETMKAVGLISAQVYEAVMDILREYERLSKEESS